MDVKVRKTYIDAIKGFTISLVVLHHVIAGIRNSIGLPEGFDALYELTVPIRMPLFFLVAGLFAQKALNVPLKKFVDGKVIHFLYFFVIWNTIDSLLRSSLSQFTNNDIAYSKALLLFWEPSFALWFIYSLLICFSLAYLIRWVPPWVQIIGALLFASTLMLTIYDDIPFVFRSTIKFMPFFLIGVHFSVKIRAYADNPLNYMLTLAVFTVVVGVMCLVKIGFVGLTNPLVFFPVALSIAMVLLFVFARLDNSYFNRLFTVIGKRSLFIYLMHFLPAAAFRVVFLKTNTITEPYVLMAVCTCLSIASCIIVYELFQEKKYIGALFHRPNWARLSKTYI